MYHPESDHPVTFQVMGWTFSGLMLLRMWIFHLLMRRQKRRVSRKKIRRHRIRIRKGRNCWLSFDWWKPLCTSSFPQKMSSIQQITANLISNYISSRCSRSSRSYGEIFIKVFSFSLKLGKICVIIKRMIKKKQYPRIPTQKLERLLHFGTHEHDQTFLHQFEFLYRNTIDYVCCRESLVPALLNC